MESIPFFSWGMSADLRSETADFRFNIRDEFQNGKTVQSLCLYKFYNNYYWYKCWSGVFFLQCTTMVDFAKNVFHIFYIWNHVGVFQSTLNRLQHQSAPYSEYQPDSFNLFLTNFHEFQIYQSSNLFHEILWKKIGIHENMSKRRYFQNE